MGLALHPAHGKTKGAPGIHLQPPSLARQTQHESLGLHRVALSDKTTMTYQILNLMSSALEISVTGSRSMRTRCSFNSPCQVPETYMYNSLIPRPSPPSSFWLVAECKNGGGRLGPFYHVNDVSVYLHVGNSYRGGEGSPIERQAWLCSFCPKCWSFECSWSEKRTAPVSKRRMHAQNAFFWSGTLPPSV